MKKTVLSISIMSILFTTLFLFSCGGETPATEETTETTEVEDAVFTGSLTFDASNSSFEWTGTKPLGEHYGTIDLKAGKISIQDGVWDGAIFDIDMTTITVADIPVEKEENGKLVSHLKTDEFFAVDSFPSANFVMTSANGNEITGDLTIKGITAPNTFTIAVDETDGYTATGTMTIDRTVYGITYKSQSVFDDLKDKFIDDEFTIDFTLAATATL